MPEPFLHVANGTCTTRLIEAAGIPGRTSIWADPLHDGPVPAGLDDDELLVLRARHLAEPGEPSFLETMNALRGWRSVIADHEAYDELVLWFEHDLFDQLNLIQILSWLPGQLPASKVSLVCLGSHPAHPRFKGLGELTPGEIAPLIGGRQLVNDDQYSLAGRAWRAFRQSTPDGLDDLRRSDTGALPFLGAALGRFLQDYPWTKDGLSRTERRFLQLAEPGRDLAVLFPRMHDGEDAYYVTDTSLATLARDLAQGSPPLIDLDAAGNQRRELLGGRVGLTAAGRMVLSGQQDAVTLRGVDRWLGGVHLQRGPDTWRWDEDAQRVRRN